MTTRLTTKGELSWKVKEGLCFGGSSSYNSSNCKFERVFYFILLILI